MSSYAGSTGAVYLGQVQVANIKSWSGGGYSKQMLDMAALEDAYDKWYPGNAKVEPITFTGFYDPADSTGQEVLRGYLLDGTAIDDLRLYYNKTATALTNFLTLGQDTRAYVSAVSNITADRDASGMCPISFTLTISDGVPVRCTAFMEAVTIAFTDDDPDTITDEDEGLVTAGFTAGMGLAVDGSTSNDGRAYTIDTGGVAAGALTLVAANKLTAEIKGDTVSLIGYTKIS